MNESFKKFTKILIENAIFLPDFDEILSEIHEKLMSKNVKSR